MEEFDTKITFEKELSTSEFTINLPEETNKKENLSYKRLKHGFSRGIRNGKLIVYFEYFKNKVVKCHLLIDLFDDFLYANINNQLEFIGVSKTDPRDSYDRNIGETLALQKALKKYTHHIVNYISRIEKEYLSIEEEIREGCLKKLNKIQEQ